MKRIFLTFLLLSAAILYSQSVHFGTAAVSGEDEFSSYYSDDITTGQYVGASNSFPSSTVITVTNPGNGQSVSLTIVKRLSQPGLFLVMSPEAGTAIGFPEDDVLDIQAVERRMNDEVFSSYAEDRPFSEDPDLNPSAELTSSVASEDADTETEALETVPSDTTVAADFTEDLPVEEPEVEPPVESSVNEYIPPVVMNSEGTAFEEGYDPLVLLDSAEDTEPEEIVEIVDDPLALAETITGSVQEPEIPLPDKFDESDLPETFDPVLPGEEEETADADDLPEPVLSEPTLVLESEDLNPDLMETSIDDLLISEPVAAEEDTTPAGLGDITVSEPEIGELPADERETVVMVPELDLGADVLDLETVAEPDVEIPDETPLIITPEIEEVVVIEPDVERETEIETEPEVAEDSEPILVEPEEDLLTMTTPAEESPENVIYFLTPGDFRPPPRTEKKEEKEKEKEPEKKIVPMTVERSELEHMIVRELRNGGSYLQLGTYSSVDVLYSTIESISDSYPTIVLTMGEYEEQVYKLLIGPISRDEKGIVITRFRSLGYGDAFLYSPH